MAHNSRSAKLAFVLLVAALSTFAQNWRPLGPAVMGGRIADIDAIPGDPATVFAAAGSGGLFVTHDGAVTWQALFDHQSTISIGAIAVQPGNPNVIWVGTGESNVRNSVSFGDGVYKSEDAGRTWRNVGLKQTQTISRIIISPRNPNIVYVAAVGHPFGPNPERGVFMTEDGGRTWSKALFLDDEHGAADLEIDPVNPDIVYAAMWRFDRKPWSYTSGDDRGGIFQSTDAGRTWRKLSNGLPALMGRIGIKVAPSHPEIVYAVTESRDGTLFRSTDRGATWNQISNERELVGRGYYFSDLRVAPDDSNKIYILADALLRSTDGGKTFRRASSSVHGDVHALWIDPKDPRRIWQGHDGGLAVSYDGGNHWEQINNIALGQFYRVSADHRKPFYNVIGGTQDNGSWMGPSRTREPAGIFNDDWRQINGIVGFGSLADEDDPNIVLTETPAGGLLLTNLITREQQNVSPQPRGANGRPASEWKYRFGWDAPLVRSPFGKKTIYFASNVIFQSSDYGRTWESISSDLTTDDKSKQGPSGGPIFTDNSSSEIYSTISALAESPAKRGVLWAGTDDGNVQVSQNGGGAWVKVKNFDGRITHIEPSRVSAQTAYITVERHMFDDFRPMVFRLTDLAVTDISAGLPENAFAWTIHEDLRNPNILYLGTELGIYISKDTGRTWAPFHTSTLPWAIAVRDIIEQPETHDLIIATHGRSIWILDNPDQPALRFSMRPTRSFFGDQTYTAPNPPYGAVTGPGLVVDSGGAPVRDVKSDVWDLRNNEGVQVLPGTYMLGNRKIEVQLDSTLNVSIEDLKLKYETEMKLKKLKNEALFRLVDSANAAPTAAILRLVEQGAQAVPPVQ